MFELVGSRPSIKKPDDTCHRLQELQDAIIHLKELDDANGLSVNLFLIFPDVRTSGRPDIRTSGRVDVTILLIVAFDNLNPLCFPIIRHFDTTKEV